MFYRKRSTTPIGGKTHEILEATKGKNLDSPESLESSAEQVSTNSITAFEPSASTSSGPNFFGHPSPYSRPDDDLPSFEQSAHDRIITLEPGRGGRQAPSPTSSINSSIDGNYTDSEDGPWVRPNQPGQPSSEVDWRMESISDDNSRDESVSWQLDAVSDNGSNSEMERFGYKAMEGEDEAVEIDVSSPAFDIGL